MTGAHGEREERAVTNIVRTVLKYKKKKGKSMVRADLKKRSHKFQKQSQGQEIL